MTSEYDDPSTWRLRTEGGIPYRRLSLRGELDYESAAAVEEILLHGDHLLAFIRESMPKPVWNHWMPIYNARRMPGLRQLVTKRISWGPWMDGKPIDPFNTDLVGQAQGAYDPIIKVTVEYDNKNKDDQDPEDPETYLEISSDTSCQVINATAQNAKFRSGGSNDPSKNKEPPAEDNLDDPSQSIPVLVPQTEWHITWTRMNYTWYREFLLPALQEMQGKVNTLTVPLFDARPETLLFLGHTMRQTRAGFDAEVDVNDPQFVQKQLAAEVGMVFLHKDIDDPDNDAHYGHNFFWRNRTNKWEELLIRPDFRKVYKAADLNKLFDPVRLFQEQQV